MNKEFLNYAYNEALNAYNNNEVPVGAIIVKDGEIISHAYNKKESSNSIISHAEILAIIEAEKKLNNWRLDGCDIYVSLDPCPMCASAIKQARISNVYSSLNNSDLNNKNIILNIFKGDLTNKTVNFVSNLDSERSKDLLSTFFSSKRS